MLETTATSVATGQQGNRLRIRGHLIPKTYGKSMNMMNGEFLYTDT
jgi:hypothetical protein